MMYINIKKLKSRRIRPYKIPSFFFSLLFPFFSFFLSFLLPPFFLSSPLMVCECAPALAPKPNSVHTSIKRLVSMQGLLLRANRVAFVHTSPGVDNQANYTHSHTHTHTLPLSLYLSLTH